MKKIFTIIAAMLLSVTLFADQRVVVWTGDTAISWNQTVYAGGQFETNVTDADMFDDLYAGDTIYAKVEAGLPDPQYVMTFKCGPGWTWTDLANTAVDGVMSYVVAADSIAKQIKRGLIFRGQGYHLKSITIAEKVDDPDWVETEVWKGDTAISWNTESWAGVQFDTHGTNSAMFADVKSGNVIRIHISEVNDGVQYSMKYKPLEEWGWADIAFAEGRGNIINIPIETEDVANFVAERGIVISGIYYKVSSIGIYAPDQGGTVAIDEVSQSQRQCQKLIKDGQLFIIRDDKTYTIQGQCVH